ncbi:vWA domain-containing protein [Spirulina sp. 06S082]|uniref:vWA domain-containing protein n=1 Tax=Spirulina sp. 06S082 TaxID=3110248 RepID=UPI002B21CAD7|nr:vWA domain-containing protein [Spirulina sp. 06S082]MEA5471887.1 vWA domain-containing protein [Spirulina sp. 06S082]
MRSEHLNDVDLCFAIDTTGSMGGFIRSAQQQLLDTMSLLSADGNINLQVGLVEYRDHPPQERSFVTRIYPLTADFSQMQTSINRLQAAGGGDAPEAVYQGVFDACAKMQWREYSCRFVMLVGDAPPHGFFSWLRDNTGRSVSSGGDTWPKGCPSGLDIQSVTAEAEKQRVKIYGLSMGANSATQEAFSAIAQLTGGQCETAQNASHIISKMVAVLNVEFRTIQFDRRVLEVIQGCDRIELDDLAGQLETSRLTVAGAISRLGKRGFLA